MNRIETNILNRAQAGLDLALEVIRKVQATGSAVWDFAAVERVTPSFANAFVMTLLEELGDDAFSKSIRLLNRNDQVISAMNASARRFSQGLRLSTQEAVCR